MSGLTPPPVLSYEGQVAVPFINRTTDPTTSNYQFNVPTIWVNTSAERGFVLLGKPMNVANWAPFSGGSVVTETLTGDSGGAVSPTANNINVLGSGSITTVGNPGTSTLTVQLTGLTNHAVQVGAGTTTLTQVSPSATSGVPLISQGAAADPTFGTAVVEGGGTGNTTFTAYSVICAGTTATGAFQNVSGVGSSGQVLTSNGASMLPTWQTNAGGDVTGPGSSADNAIARFDGTTGKIIQNSVALLGDSGNLDISGTASGLDNYIIIRNTNNTAGSGALIQAEVEGSTAADAYYRASIASGGQSWLWGLDNSDSDAFAVSSSTTLGTNNVVRASTAGQINYPLQPRFLAFVNANIANVTGNGAEYQIIANWQEAYDVGSNFSAGIFTAPVSGTYEFSATINMQDLAGVLEINYQLLISGVVFYFFEGLPNPGTNGRFGCSGTVRTVMSAGEQASIRVKGSGAAGDTADVTGDGTVRYTYFSGCLIA